MKIYQFFTLLLVLTLCLGVLTACDEMFIQTGGRVDETTPTENTTAENTQEETTTETPPETTEPPETQPPTPKKRVALTFDDGPSRQGLTEKLVDEFKKYGGKATFFVLGNLISSSTGDALAYAHENGFEFGIHGYTHEIYYDTCTEQDFLRELELTKKAIETYVDAEVTLLRPPGGRITEERALLSGYPVILWSVDTEDWRYKSRADDATIQTGVNAIVENALKDIEDGDIILMHEIYTNSYEATCLILERLDEMGFEFVTVSELIGEEQLTVGSFIYSKEQIR